jgi:hypothetical protein
MVSCTFVRELSVTGWEIASGTGRTMREFADGGYGAQPMVFALLVIPISMVFMSFGGKSFRTLRNISFAGFVAKVGFMIGVRTSSVYQQGYIVLTGHVWFILFAYIGLVVLGHWQSKHGIR